MKASEMKDLTDKSESIRVDEKSYKNIISQMKKAARKGKYTITVPSNSLERSVAARLISDGYRVSIERRIDGNTLIDWKGLKKWANYG